MVNNNLIKMMEEQDEQLRTQLMEGMLEYIEGNKSFRAVLSIGITAHNKKHSPTMPEISEVVEALNIMGNDVVNGKNYSRDKIKETFTTMLEKLAK